MIKAINALSKGDWVHFRYMADVGHYTEDIQELSTLAEVISVDIVSHNGIPNDAESYYTMNRKGDGGNFTMKFSDITKIVEVRRGD